MSWVTKRLRDLANEIDCTQHGRAAQDLLAIARDLQAEAMALEERARAADTFFTGNPDERPRKLGELQAGARILVRKIVGYVDFDERLSA